MQDLGFYPNYSLNQVHFHQCIQHGQQTGGAGIDYAAGETMAQLASWKRCGEARTTGVLQCSPGSLTSVPGKVMELIILSAIKWNVQDKQGIRPSQHGLVKGRSCLTNLLSYGRVTCVVDEGKAVDVSA